MLAGFQGLPILNYSNTTFEITFSQTANLRTHEGQSPGDSFKYLDSQIHL